MSPEDLNEGDLELGDLAMHKDASKVRLDLVACVHIGLVDGGRPPQDEFSVGDLIQTGPLGIRQFLFFIDSSNSDPSHVGK